MLRDCFIKHIKDISLHFEVHKLLYFLKYSSPLSCKDIVFNFPMEYQGTCLILQDISWNVMMPSQRWKNRRHTSKIRLMPQIVCLTLLIRKFISHSQTVPTACQCINWLSWNPDSCPDLTGNWGSSYSLVQSREVNQQRNLAQYVSPLPPFPPPMLFLLSSVTLLSVFLLSFLFSIPPLFFLLMFTSLSIYHSTSSNAQHLVLLGCPWQAFYTA